MEPLLNKVLGCLSGGAAGDALGYPFEFVPSEMMPKRGAAGSSLAHADRRRPAQISCNTQQALYAACGLLNGCESGLAISQPEALCNQFVWAACREWYALQLHPRQGLAAPACFVSADPAMRAWRSPDSDSLNALREGRPGTLLAALNAAKSCGGLSRAAAVALLNAGGPLAAEKAFLAAEAAALTHGSALGFIPAALLACVLSEAVYPSRRHPSLKSAVALAMDCVRHQFGRVFPLAEHVLQRVAWSIRLAETAAETADAAAVESLGSGFMAEEALAIAVFCSLRHPGSFEKGVFAAVNHGGNSSAAGSLTGQILGAWLGFEAIPRRLRENVEAARTVEEVARRLAAARASS